MNGQCMGSTCRTDQRHQKIQGHPYCTSKKRGNQRPRDQRTGRTLSRLFWVPFPQGTCNQSARRNRYANVERCRKEQNCPGIADGRGQFIDAQH